MLPEKNKLTVLLVGFEDQDNLGIRYLASSLREAGHSAFIVKFQDDPSPIIESIEQHLPGIVGFSLIFQYYTERFGRLIRALRTAGVNAHFTIGGHYASFEPAQLFEFIPELDSIIRFEGEETLVELADRIARNEDWSDIRGMACIDNGSLLINAARQGRKNLDELPWPVREDIDYSTEDFPTASMIGGRGCPWVCSFCSIITFYEGNGTRGRRLRSPALIVDEVEYLRDRGVRIILWQDDDFLAGGKAGVRWAHAVAEECIRRGLNRDLRWKISCRSDEVKAESLAPLVEAGLTHVYLGVEAGDPESLHHLNKVLQPESHFRAAEVLKQLNLSFDFGFMLMEPWSTFDTIRNNLKFLEEFAGDGYAPAGYCRMLPYVGTGVEKKLLAEDRLEKKDCYADYHFLDPPLDRFYEWQLGAFKHRNHGPNGTLNLLRLLNFESHLDFAERPFSSSFCNKVQAVTSLSNHFMLATLSEALAHFEESGLNNKTVSDEYLLALSSEHNRQDEHLRNDILRILANMPVSFKRKFVVM